MPRAVSSGRSFSRHAHRERSSDRAGMRGPAGLLSCFPGDEPRVARSDDRPRPVRGHLSGQTAVLFFFFPRASQSVLQYVNPDAGKRDPVTTPWRRIRSPADSTSVISTPGRSPLPAPIKAGQSDRGAYPRTTWPSHVFTPARISVLNSGRRKRAISLRTPVCQRRSQEREPRIRRLVDF